MSQSPDASSAGRCPRSRTLMLYGERCTAPCMKRSCAYCGELWLGDTRIRALAAAASLQRPVALVTITAPGKDVLPWDASGKRVEPAAAALWNTLAPRAWRRLHARAAKVARRVAREHGVEWCLLMKAWEYQRRGVLHLHLVVPAASGGEFAASTAYVDALAASSVAEGFGYVDRGKLPFRGARQSARVLQPVAPHRAAAYVASYMVSTGAGKEGIAEVARKQGVPGPVFYVTRTLTSQSGVTMRSLRARRRISCRYPDAHLSEDAWRTACLLDAIERRGPKLAEGERERFTTRALKSNLHAVVDLETGELITPTVAALPKDLQEVKIHATCPLSRAFVRLDCVPHRDPAGVLPWVWRRVFTVM